MVMIKPFRALRPKKEYAKDVASPPYDVLSSEEAREMAKGNPYSFLHVVKPEIDLPEGIDLYSEEVYEKAKENLEKLIKEGVLFFDEKPHYYLYSQKMGDHIQTGLVALSSCKDYVEGRIKKHEFTKPDKVKDRAKLILTLGAQTGPVFLTYHAKEKLTEAIENYKKQNEPEYDFVADDGIAHTVWVVKDEKLEKLITDTFHAMEYTYIADGHHRSEAAGYIYQNHPGPNRDFFLTVIFPHNEMKIMDYNRVVKDLNGLAEEEFFAKLKEKFSVEEVSEGKPTQKHHFGMYIGGKWYRLIIKPELIDESDPVESLDAALLQKHCLAPILGIENPRTDKRIDFVGGIRGMKELEKLVNSGKFKVAFALYPVNIEDLMRVADSGKVMPPKSTWFEPKLRSGLFTNKFE